MIKQYMRQIWAAAACGAAIVGATVTIPAQTGNTANTVAGHVAAAKAAADDSWLILYSELCGGAMGFGGRASSLPPARACFPRDSNQPRPVWVSCVEV